MDCRKGLGPSGITSGAERLADRAGLWDGERDGGAPAHLASVSRAMSSRCCSGVLITGGSGTRGGARRAGCDWGLDRVPDGVTGLEGICGDDRL